MVTRRLPDSDEKRNVSFTVALSKNDSLPPGVSVLSADVVLRLEAMQPDFNAKVVARRVALANQTLATEALDALKKTLRRYISHYFQSLNNGIDRGLFPKQARAYYGLDVNSNSVPSLSSEYKLLYWGDNVKTGDAARVAAGGAAMAMPSAAEVDAVFVDMKAANDLQSNYKDVYYAAQESVANLRPDADSLILRIWNEVETYYSEEDIESKRRKSREWGVVYSESEVDYSLTGSVSDTVGNKLIDAEVKVVEADVTAVSDENGDYKVPSVADGLYTLEVSKATFVPQTIHNYQLFRDTTKSLDFALLAETGTLVATVYFEGLPLQNALVTIVETGQSGDTNFEGQATIPNIAPGNYDAEATAPGKQPLRMPVTIEPGLTSLLTFNMLPE